ncbi:MAG: AzlC family ABC transporter permease [Synergistaceae bacterium]|nr:AzlC family ABC transporter permease [Synergistaceae bacterium]
MSKRDLYCFSKGMLDAIPILLGYIAVSFTLGIGAKNAGLSPFQALLSALTQNASAGQFAGYSLIAAGAGYLEVVIMIVVANARYLLMSCAMSQKISPKTPLRHRMLLAVDITDEIFGLSVAQPRRLNPFYTYGMVAAAAPGWAFGTFFGVIVGNVLPPNIVTALSVGLFGMFIAVIVPPARKNFVIALLIVVSMAASFAFSRLSFIELSAGMRTIVLTVAISGAAAFLFPLNEERRANAA